MPGPNHVLDKGMAIGGVAAVPQFSCVKQSAKETVIIAGAGDKVFGVLQEDVSASDATLGRVAGVRPIGLGISRCIAAAAIAVDDWVTVAANGRVTPTTTAGALVVGRATTAATAAGDHVDVLLTGGSI
jgi:hypothetical protein